MYLENISKHFVFESQVLITVPLLVHILKLSTQNYPKKYVSFLHFFPKEHMTVIFSTLFAWAEGGRWHAETQ